MKNQFVTRMTLSGLLCAIAIAIPVLSPFKILLEPASFTLASHVPIFIAMMLSPAIAVFVSLGAACGFLMAGFPIVVVLRALSHVVFAFIGAYLLQKNENMLRQPLKATSFNLGIAVVHAAMELLVVAAFYFNNSMSAAYYAKGFVMSVLLLVGVGTVVHSMVDFGIAMALWAVVKRQVPA